MNIFCLDLDPVLAAQYHNNKQNVKMVLEQVQLLCTAHRILDGTETIKKVYINGSCPARYKNKKVWKLSDKRDSLLYSVTHQNHPSAIWCRKNVSNYNWLYRLTVELAKEYTYRYGKIHKCERDGLLELLKTPPNNIPDGEFTQPTPAMPDYCIVPNDSVASYRKYYIEEKQHLADWSGKINGRPVPEWFKFA